MSYAYIPSSDQSEVRRSLKLHYSRRANITKKTPLCPRSNGKDSTIHFLEGGFFIPMKTHTADGQLAF